jgi:hypothetical protein
MILELNKRMEVLTTFVVMQEQSSSHRGRRMVVLVQRMKLLQPAVVEIAHAAVVPPLLPQGGGVLPHPNHLVWTTRVAKLRVMKNLFLALFSVRFQILIWAWSLKYWS